MNLFLKIFLWFLAASAVMVGVVFFLNWTVSEPVVSRWQNSIRNQNNVYAQTIEQIYRSQGEAGIREFLERVRNVETVTEVIVVRRDGQLWLTDTADTSGYRN